jgi:hypothetical protein
MNDHTTIVENVYQLGLYADQLGWDELLVLLDDEVRLDYTSLVGGEPCVVRATDLIAAWRSYLPGFDSTQHLIAAPLVQQRGDCAVVRSQLIATFIIDDGGTTRLWQVAGTYVHTLKAAGPGRWKFVDLALHVSWQSGDPTLYEAAAERVRLGIAGR